MELWRKMLYLRESVGFRWNTADVNKPIMLRCISKLITLCREFMGLSLWRGTSICRHMDPTTEKLLWLCGKKRMKFFKYSCVALKKRSLYFLFLKEAQ